jgi:hypothetical protein
MGKGNNFPELKRPGREADHLLPSSTKSVAVSLPHMTALRAQGQFYSCVTQCDESGRLAWLQPFLALALDGYEWSASPP